MYNFARVAILLNMKIRNGQLQTFEELSSDDPATLENLESKLGNLFVLVFSRLQGSSKVATDTCDTQIGFALLQKQPALTAKSIKNWSCSINTVERAHKVTLWKCLAVPWAVVSLQTYLEGCGLTVHTNHDVQKWIFNLMDIAGMLVCLQLNSSGFEFNVVRCTGAKHEAADSVMRLKSIKSTQTPFKDEIPVLCITTFILLKSRDGGYVNATLRRFKRERSY